MKCSIKYFLAISSLAFIGCTQLPSKSSDFNNQMRTIASEKERHFHLKGNFIFPVSYIWQKEKMKLALIAIGQSTQTSFGCGHGEAPFRIFGFPAWGAKGNQKSEKFNASFGEGYRSQYKEQPVWIFPYELDVKFDEAKFTQDKCQRHISYNVHVNGFDDITSTTFYFVDPATVNDDPKLYYSGGELKSITCGSKLLCTSYPKSNFMSNLILLPEKYEQEIEENIDFVFDDKSN